jgi:pimeloyl-ACP methyl ester carboxylesterase
MTPCYAFLHGGGQGGWVWDETIVALQQQTMGRCGRMLALDVPGCGAKRGRDTSGLDVDDIASELIAELEHAGMKDVILVGHSQAGTLLPRLAERVPGLFRRLIYVSCCAPLPGQTILQMMGSGQHGSHPEEVGWPLDPAQHPHQEQYRLMFCNDMSEKEAAHFLAKLGRDRWPDQSIQASDWRYDHLRSVASTFVLCLQDGILTPPWQERFAQRLHTQRVVRIDAGHQVMNTRPHALAESLRYEASIT